MKASPGPLRGLYAITPDALCANSPALERAAAAALRGGARLLQLRDKSGDAITRAANARTLLALCRRHGAQLIINDDVELALAIGADGVHLGASDAPLAQARVRLGDQALIGISCANVLARALAAQAAGASYVAFGRFHPSNTKPGAPQAEASLLREGRTHLQIPICAIGGITPDNAPALIADGANLIAAVEGVFGSGGSGSAQLGTIEAAARAYSRLFAE